MDFHEKRGIAYCGLACILCSNKDCPGCAVSIANGGDCSVGKCAVRKGLDGCYACSDYDSCAESMLHGKRNKAFNRYAREFGLDPLIDRLRVNFENGITYHTPGQTSGDYDVLGTEAEIYQLLRYGRNDPYAHCPEFTTEHFHLRQVRMEDAEDLLCFYGDLSEWMFYGNALSNGIFTSNHPTLDEMQKCIASWLGEYKNKFYIRFSVIDKATGKAVGTIEVFDNLDKAKRGAALHIDLSTPYEKQAYITELLALSDKEFFHLFGFKNLIIRAVPDAVERLAALRSAGYELFESESREHYYMKERLAYLDKVTERILQRRMHGLYLSRKCDDIVQLAHDLLGLH
jgi:RimJ/RimL family protein N-acetyltransferase